MIEDQLHARLCHKNNIYFLNNHIMTKEFSSIMELKAIARQQKILCKWEMREVIGNICKTFPYIFIVYYFFLLPLVKS